MLQIEIEQLIEENTAFQAWIHQSKQSIQKLWFHTFIGFCR